MNGRRGLGPVFFYDMLSMARRWQLYASRAAFVLFLLIGILIAWSNSDRFVPRGAAITLQQLAQIGTNFFYALAGVQLSFILLAAPASAAGSICIDRARGTLLHMMVTDLSDAEIVLGRLGSRLIPVFGLVACAVPVAALAGLLGGIEFAALLGLFIVSVALAILGCSLALAISVKASKTHEVLMAVYLAFGVWLLSVPIWQGIAATSKKTTAPPDWFLKTNPFVLVYAPYTKPGFLEPMDCLVFLVGTLLVSALLVGWSILRLRRAVVESTGRTERARIRFRWMSRLFPSFKGPTLDGNPVLWRGLLSLTWAVVLWGIHDSVNADVINASDSAIQFGYIIQVFFGLLMVAATSATVLAEERTRGSLDILLSTPMSTRSIVLAKWWGAYRTVLSLAIMPVLVAIFLASASPDIPAFATGVKWGLPVIPLTVADRVKASLCIIADFLVSGALIVSIGLLLATWISRVGRAVGTSVMIFFLLGIGWPIASEFILQSFRIAQTFGTQNDHYQALSQTVPCLSPAFGTMTSMQMLSGIAFSARDTTWNYLTIVILIKLMGALFLAWLTVKTFNRRLGRVVESRPSSFRPPEEPTVGRKRWQEPVLHTAIEVTKSLEDMGELPAIGRK